MDGFRKDKYPSCLASQWEKATPQSCPVGLGAVNAAADCDNGLFLGFLPSTYISWDHPPTPSEPQAFESLSQNLLQG